MNEKELGQRLLDGADAATTPADVAALTQRVLRRDRRRVTLLSAACVVAWMAVVMLPWSLILPMLAKVVEHPNELDGTAATAPAGARAGTTPANVDAREGTTQLLPLHSNTATAPVGDARGETTQVLEVVRQAVILTFVSSLISMFVAAVFTVALIFVSRRATLRQVNARLAEISAHVQALARTHG